MNPMDDYATIYMIQGVCMNPMDDYTTTYMIQGVYMNPMDDYATIYMIQGVYMNPMDDYATTPANAQIFFTSLPLMCIWFVYTIITIFSRWRNSAKPAGPITQVQISDIMFYLVSKFKLSFTFKRLY